ncbi:MAG: hypothetical protein VX370_03415 [Bacteroidota bacterium]|nr:hypothetical protein [Bacteroidota bacterium]
MFSTEMSIIQKDKKIGKFLHKTFFKGLSFSNYITVSQSFLSVFRGINNQATLFDVQHGIIYSKKSSYINNNHPSENIFNNDVKLLLNGDMYKNILKNSDVTNYYSENSFSLGYSLMPFLKKSHSLNKNVVVSLQFTDDHTQEENKKMFILLESFVSQHQDFTFYLRSHHRTNNDIYLNKLITYDHVLLSTQDLFDDLESCSFHVTFYSTTTFDAGLCGIPTYFLNSKHIDLFYKEFHYPFNKDVSLLELFNNYSVFSSEIQKWSSLYYKNIDETLFLSLLKT